VRNKVVRIIQKFNSCGVIATETIMDWCMESLESLDPNQFSLNYAQSQLIMNLILGMQQQGENIVALYVKDI